MSALLRARTVCLLLAPALLLASAPVLVQSSGAQRYLDAAALLYENLEYERALDQLKKARTVSGGVDDDVNIALYEGVVLSDLGKKDEAVAAFREGLYLKPDAQLPVKVAPKTAAAFATTRADVKRELAPILARRHAEEEKKRVEAEKLEQAKKEAEKVELARKSDAERKRLEAEQAKQAADEKQRLEAKRRADEAAAQADRPERRTLTLTEDPNRKPDFVPPPPPARGVPVAPFVFGGMTVAAAGVGGVFGYLASTQVSAARAANFQSETVDHLHQANTDALVANIAFGVAGAAGIATLISLFVGRDVPPPPPAQETP